MPKVLITGIAGFIGSAIAHECVARGYEVRGIDNLCAGNIDNIADIEEIEFYKGSLADRRLLRELCRDVEIVFHQAALPSVAGSIVDPLTSHMTNLNGTLNLLMEARRRGVRRVIYAASSAAYGDSPVLPKSELLVPAPISPYAIQKLAGEYYMQCFAHIYGIDGFAPLFQCFRASPGSRLGVFGSSCTFHYIDAVRYNTRDIWRRHSDPGFYVHQRCS